MPVGPLRDFKDMLYEVYEAAGAPTLDEIVVEIAADDSLAARPNRDTVRRCIGSPQLPAQQSVAVAVMAVLARRAAWDMHDMTRRVVDLWLRARAYQPPGQPIADCVDPSALEVHRAIEADDENSGLPMLPAYVVRPHDTRLRSLAEEAVSGQSRIAVLVGGSSTGKTRACWEAVQLLPPEWRLWIVQGISAALEELPSIAPCTVVWFDETHNRCLHTPAGEVLADGLRALLHDPDRTPVLVLGTMWEETWHTLTAVPADRDEDRHKRARALLTGCAVAVPSAFTTVADRTALREQAAIDPRLNRALANARDGEVTQYLAGTPVLVERYRNAPPAAKALIDAAMDVRLLGHGPDLPLPLLEAAAPAYLTNAQWQRLARLPDWLERALAYTEAECRGVPGPLARMHPRPGEPRPGEPSYRLADFLEQEGRRARKAVRSPAGAWDALIGFAHRGDLVTLARSAQHRGLLRIAMDLCSAAAVADDSAAFPTAGKLLEHAGHIDAATAWYERNVLLGDCLSLSSVTDMLLATDRGSEARALLLRALHSEHDNVRQHAADRLSEVGEGHHGELTRESAAEWLRPAADVGHTTARWQLAVIAQESGELEQAISGFQRIAEDDRWWVHEAAGRAIALMRENGRVAEGLAWICGLAESGDATAMRLAAETLDAEGRVEESLRWYAAAARAGTLVSLPKAVERLLDANRARDALALIDECVSMGTAHVLPVAAELLWHRLGRTEEALALYGRAARLGDAHAMRCAAENLLRAGRAKEARDWYQRAASAGTGDATRHASGRLWGTAQQETALSWSRQAVRTGHEETTGHGEALTTAEGDAPVALEHANRPLPMTRPAQEATAPPRGLAQGGERPASFESSRVPAATTSEDSLRALLKQAEEGDIHAAEQAVDALERAGRDEEALVLWERIAPFTDVWGHSHVVRLLRRTGRHGEAESLTRYGWEPDATIARPWDAPAPPPLANGH
ncbi:hypothetical protein GCM10010306_054590 [Streptomyces umbrinus]|nr:hypothetical protein GCM10010306_054590 [Streptomyces umbrinus]